MGPKGILAYLVVMLIVEADATCDCSYRQCNLSRIFIASKPSRTHLETSIIRPKSLQTFLETMNRKSFYGRA